jgi:urease accessory protein
MNSSARTLPCSISSAKREGIAQMQRIALPQKFASSRLANPARGASSFSRRAKIPLTRKQSGNVRVKSIQRPAALAVAVLIPATLITEPALAHSIGSSAAGFAGGFLHPLTGLDHMLAMVCVGIWGAELGAPAVWLLPIAFPLIMAVGGAFGVFGVPLPAGELLIALSVVVLGTLVALAWELPVAVALTIVGIFAIAHGHAHGMEMPGAVDALGFTIGFVLATGLLHLTGIAIGVLTRWPAGVLAIRACGCAVAVTGCYFVVGYAGA